MTPDKNNFQLLLQELEARKLDISNSPHIANPYNEAIDDAIEIVTKHKHEDFEFTEWAAQNYVRLHGCWIGKYSNQTIKQNQKSTQEVYNHYLQIRGILPKSVTKHTAPQPNWEEVEKLVQRYSREERFKVSEEEFIAETWRTRIGYTLDANGKAVALPSSGSATTK